MSQHPAYSIGDAVTLTASFVDGDGDPADPDEVHLGLMHADGASEVLAVEPGGVEKTGVGEYRYELVAEKSGKHRYRWIGTGAVADAQEGYFWVSLSSTAHLDPCNNLSW